jgi:hypothetical protein
MGNGFLQGHPSVAEQREGLWKVGVVWFAIFAWQNLDLTSSHNREPSVSTFKDPSNEMSIVTLSRLCHAVCSVEPQRDASRKSTSRNLLFNLLFYLHLQPGNHISPSPIDEDLPVAWWDRNSATARDSSEEQRKWCNNWCSRAQPYAVDTDSKDAEKCTNVSRVLSHVKFCNSEALGSICLLP